MPSRYALTLEETGVLLLPYRTWVFCLISEAIPPIVCIAHTIKYLERLFEVYTYSTYLVSVVTVIEMIGGLFANPHTSQQTSHAIDYSLAAGADMDIDMDIDLGVDPDVAALEAEAMAIVRNEVEAVPKVSTLTLKVL